MVMSGSSVMTALAAAFMRSRARLSLGFSKPYLAQSLARLFVSSELMHAIENGCLLLCKGSSVDSHYDPCIWEDLVWKLKLPHIFESHTRIQRKHKTVSSMSDLSRPPTWNSPCPQPGSSGDQSSSKRDRRRMRYKDKLSWKIDRVSNSLLPFTRLHTKKV